LKIAVPQRLKPDSKQSLYRSAEALRHPKSRAMASFSASPDVVPIPGRVLPKQIEFQNKLTFEDD
jgi:hypothetical protein